MKDQVLDYFGDFEDEFDQNTKIVTVKYFYFESEARLFAAGLKDAGIKCFVSNTNTITAFPLGGGGIGLHVKEEDLKLATAIVQKMEKNKNTVPDEDFRNADLEEIAYQKSLNKPPLDLSPTNFFAFIILLILIILMGLFV